MHATGCTGRMDGVRRKCYAVLVLLICTQHRPVYGVPDTSDLFPYGTANGDAQLHRNDDGSSGRQMFTQGQTFSYFGASYNHLYVNTNGGISFVDEVRAFTPSPFPASSKPFVAIFWVDIDLNRNDGNIFYRETRDADVLSKYTQEVLSFYGSLPGFTGVTWAYIATYYDVTYYRGSSSSARNTFQIALGTDGTYSFALYKYAEMSWLQQGGNYAQIGFDAGDNTNYFAVEGSRTSAIANIDPTLMFRIDSNTIEIVEPETCASLSSVSGGSYSPSSCTSGTHAVGVVCTVSCNTGYNMDGNNNQFTCLDTGEWSSSTYPTCIMGCPSLSAFPSGSYSPSSCTSSRKAVNTVCQAQCNSGYINDGGSQFTCQSSGAWSSASSPTCTLGCASLPSITDGSYSPSDCNSASQRIGTECLASCDTNYFFNMGGSSFTCQNDGSWDSTNSAQCQEMFMIWTADNWAKIYLSGVMIEENSDWPTAIHTPLPADTKVVAFEVGDSGGIEAFLAAYSNGWSTADLEYWRCTPNDPGSSLDWTYKEYDDTLWETPTDLGTNGMSPWGLFPDIAADAKWIWTFGQEDRIWCRHHLDSRIVGEPPPAEPVICPSLDPITDGSYSPAECTTTEPSAYTVCTASCDTGFYNDGGSAFTCAINRRWTPSTLPDCQRACQSLPTVSDGSYSQASCSSSLHEAGASCVASCDAGYYNIGGEEFTCQSGGTWSSTNYPDCRQKCPSLTGVSNGQYSAANCTTDIHMRDTVCSVQCDTGYYVTGDSVLTCTDTGAWDSNNYPTCPIYHCAAITTLTLSGSSSPPLITNVQYDNSDCNTNGVDYTEVCTASCATGYTLVGLSTFTCNDGAVWSSDQVPQCEIVSCPAITPVTSSTRCTSLTCVHPSILNANYDNPLCETSGLVYSLSCTASCDEGYNLVGEQVLQCTASGQWSSTDFPRCEVKQCAALPTPPNGTYVPPSCVTGSINYGQTCIMQCDGIARVQPENSETQTCRSDTQWTYQADGTPLPFEQYCRINNCESFPEEGINSTLSTPPEPFLVGVSVEYSCITGFEPQSGDELRFCVLTREWDGQPLNCQRVQCTAPEIPIHVLLVPDNTTTDANGTFTEPTEYFYTDILEYQCNSTYEWLAGDLSRECQDDGTWSGDAPICRMKACYSLPEVPNSQLSAGSGEVLSSIIYTCDSGFVHTRGDLVRECLPSEEWSGSSPTCTEIQCGEAPVVNNTQYHMIERSVGSLTHYTCNTGYEKVTGDDYLTCNITGQWEGQLLQCQEFGCGPLPAGNYHVNVSSDLGSKAIQYCPTGTRHVGGISTTSCLISGEWQISHPICEEIDCGAPEQFLHRTVNLLSAGVTVYNSLAIALCAEGTVGDSDTAGPPYTLQSVCQQDETWSVKNAPCIPLTCNMTEILGANLTYNGLNQLDVMLQSCLPGYYMVNNVSDTRECLLGEWTGQDIQCQETTCPELVTDKGLSLRYNNTASNNGEEIHGVYSTVTYVCDSLHQQVPGVQMTRTCLYSGVWDGEAPICTQILCPDLVYSWPELLLVSDGLLPGSVAMQTCAVGFRFLNNITENILECLENGTWSGEILPCDQVVTCDEQPIVIDGVFQLMDNTTNATYLSRGEVICDYSFVALNGDDVIECGPDGEWVGDVQNCIAIECESETVAPMHGTMNVSGITMNSIVTYSCEERYQLVGDLTRTCLENSTWTGQIPTCERFNCTTLAPDVDNAKWYYNKDYYPIDEGVYYVCNPKYEPLNASQVMERYCVPPGVWTDNYIACTAIAQSNVTEFVYVELPKEETSMLAQMYLESDSIPSHVFSGLLAIIIMSLIGLLMVILDISKIRTDCKTIGLFSHIYEL